MVGWGEDLVYLETHISSLGPRSHLVGYIALSVTAAAMTVPSQSRRKKQNLCLQDWNERAGASSLRAVWGEYQGGWSGAGGRER